MKKILAIILAVAFVFLLVGCDGGSQDDDPIIEGKYKADWEKIKIGFACWSYTGLLESGYKSNLEALANDLNIELVFAEGTFNAETALAACETLVQAGCKGIITILATPAISKLCQDNGVYFGIYCTKYVSMQAIFEANPYFVGWNSDSDYDSAYEAIEAMYQAGCREMLFCAPEPGDGSGTHDMRWKGMLAAAAKHSDFKFYEYRGTAYTEALENAMALYPNLDGLFVTAGQALDSYISIIDAAGKSDKIKIGLFDIQDTTGLYMEDGQLVVTVGGQFCNPALVLACMLNEILGTPLVENGECYIESPFITIVGADGFDDYMKYINGSVPPYTGQEILSCIKKCNPDATLATVQALADGYSIANIKNIHAKYFN